ncbi:MAG: YidC/Oxa1 family membrane protein insertase, partial [Clostridia bacterium]|nr:YidC/Oxa1 family membrane protein insertase [Clostridia bacterium]
MAFLSAILFAADIKQPGGLWELLLLQVFTFIQNYGWRVVLFTLCLKLLLSPLDIFQRYKARKNQKITEKLKPQMEKLQKQYTDQTILAQKQMQLNKQAGFSYMSSCLPAIITLVIMFTLLASLNNVSQYMNFKDYYEMYTVYNEAIAEYETLSDNDIAKLKNDGFLVEGYTDASGNEQPYQIQYGQKKVYDYYEENKTSFLWIKNIWSPDVPWKKEVNDYKTFQGNIGKYGTDVSKSGFTAEELELMKARYSTVMGMLLKDENNGGNGYLILPILSVLLSVGTQLIS